MAGPLTPAESAGECARCGDCCEHLGFDVDAHRGRLEALLAAPDPADDPQAWADTGWRSPESAARSRTDAAFILAHWHPHPGGDPGDFTCDMFDRATRLCGDHAGRPPVCRDYPWYGTGPSPDRAVNLPQRCSYRDAVPVTLTTKPQPEEALSLV